MGSIRLEWRPHIVDESGTEAGYVSVYPPADSLPSHHLNVWFGPLKRWKFAVTKPGAGFRTDRDRVTYQRAQHITGYVDAKGRERTAFGDGFQTQSGAMAAAEGALKMAIRRP